MQHYPNAAVEYKFTNRGKTKFTRKMYERVLEALKSECWHVVSERLHSQGLTFSPRPSQPKPRSNCPRTRPSGYRSGARSSS